MQEAARHGRGHGRRWLYQVNQLPKMRANTTKNRIIKLINKAKLIPSYIKYKLHPAYRRFRYNELVYPAEEILANVKNISLPPGSEVYLSVGHGRISHWVFVTTNLYALALQKGWTPRLQKLSREAFPNDLVSLFYSRSGRSRRSFFSPPRHCLRSNYQQYFELPELGRALKKIDSALHQKAANLLAQDLGVVAKHLSTPPDNLLAVCGLNSAAEFHDLLTVSVHLRRGDLSILYKENYIGTEIEHLFENDILIRINNLGNAIPENHHLFAQIGNWAFISHSDFTELEQMKCCHSILRKSLPKPQSYYLEKIEEIKQANNQSIAPKFKDPLVLVFSDGFDQLVSFLAERMNCIDPKTIKSVIENVEFATMKKAGYKLVTGEAHPLVDLSGLLSYAFNANYVLADDSGFPMDLLNVLHKSLGDLQ